MQSTVSKNRTVWVEESLFHPKTPIQFLLSFALLPISLLYCFIVILKRITSKKVDPKIPVVSIGNLTIGGSGKTPVTIALAKQYEDTAVILRGYKRESFGLVLVSFKGEIKCDVKKSGDEAMEYAKALPKATVIVAENRLKAIEYAKKLGCKIVFLDDGFSKSFIKKFDILIKPEIEPRFPFCLPSGAYREPKFMYRFADLILKEGKDFKRKVTIKNPTTRMVLVTGISKPERLQKYLPKELTGKVIFEDHHKYKKDELSKIVKKYKATSILTTNKDAVKMEDFGFKLSILELDIEITKEANEKIKSFLSDFR